MLFKRLKKSKFFMTIKLISILMLIGAVTLIVFLTGGVKFVYAHTMYIPIVIGGLLLGYKWGILFGIIGGILLGPIMPLDTLNSQPQELTNWLFRLAIFSSIGFLSGYAKEKFEKQNSLLARTFSMNNVTNIPNFNIIKSLDYEKYKNTNFLVASIVINNYQKMMHVFNQNFYLRFLRKIHDKLDTLIKYEKIIINSEANKLWFVTTNCNLEQVNQDISKVLKSQFHVDDIPIYFEFSIGYDLINGITKLSNSEAFYNADLCANDAKIRNKEYVVFDGNKKYNDYDYSLLADFLLALENNDTYLVYQPKVSLKGKNKIMLEALIRWKHPTKGVLNPNLFIPMIEETQLIHNLSIWVFNKVVNKIQELDAKGIDATISINLSSKNLFNKSFLNSILEILKMRKVDPSKIEFEIVERTIMDKPDRGVVILNRLRNIGFKISIDDFGKEFSSLSYLYLLPLDYIKIDKVFIDKMTENEKVVEVIKSSISLAHKIGCEVVCEGIETKEQLEVLTELGCDYIQGFYIAKPLKDNELFEWIKKNNI